MADQILPFVYMLGILLLVLPALPGVHIHLLLDPCCRHLHH